MLATVRRPLVRTVVKTRVVVKRSSPYIQKFVKDVSISLVADTFVHHKFPDIVDFVTVGFWSNVIEFFIIT
jgi:hypothetical protein